MEKLTEKTRSTKKDQIKVLEDARDFTLRDTSGSEVMLSDYFGKKIVVLVFNRGFA